MEITIKSSKVAKTGTNKAGEWELIVVSADNGIEYTTFDKKANAGSGAVLEIGDPTIKDGKFSFKECSIISEGKQVASSTQSDMSKEDWALKQEIERASIENQVRAKLINELVIADKSPADLKAKLFTWLGKLEDSLKAEPKASKKEPQKPDTEQAKDDTEELFPEDPAKTPETAQDEQQPTERLIDADWLKTSLQTLAIKKPEVWNEANILSFMLKSYKVEGKTVLEAAGKLDAGKAKHFCKHIEDALK